MIWTAAILVLVAVALFVVASLILLGALVAGPRHPYGRAIASNTTGAVVVGVVTCGGGCSLRVRLVEETGIKSTV